MSRSRNTLRITEIFHSLQGESGNVGLPSVFIRLTGCPLRCQYCDTSYAFNGGKLLTIADILEQISPYQCKHVCVTGGEPLAQPGCIELMTALCNAGYAVSIETSGARDIQAIDPRVLIVMDIKTPDSLEADKNLWDNLLHLKPQDEVKFVICSRTDYQWARQTVTEHQLDQRFNVLFSPSWEQVKPTDLANWIVEDRLAVRFQLQLHKILWDNAPGY